MPLTVKIAIASIFLSLVSMLAADLVIMLDNPTKGYNDPVIIGLNVGWTVIIAWIIHQVSEKKDMRLLLLMLAALTFIFSAIAPDLIETMLQQALLVGESLFLLIGALLLNREPSARWRAEDGVANE